MIRRSKRASSPVPNSQSRLRLIHRDRRRFGLGYSGRGCTMPPASKLGGRSLTPHNIPSVRLGRPTKHVSVKDVAARSGVSFQTTSKVLNGKGSVSAVTRARILRAGSDLGYVPNLQARSLVMQRTRAVGLIPSAFSHHHL